MNLDKRYIAIEGVVGVGKTSLAELLAEAMNGELVLENSDGNPFLENFYENIPRYGFQTQVFFLLSRYQQQRQVCQQNLFKACAICDYIFARDRIFAALNLAEEELKLYEEIYSLLDTKLVKPDLVVYLQASVKTLKKRVRLRNRSVERSMTDDYLEKLCEAFNHFFFHYSESPLLVVNTDEIDFVSNPGDLGQLAEKIKYHKAGKEYFVPISVSM